ncbi:MAG TPA: carbohydrate ABC transporter permease [Rectinemataceae bacterium]|nr:carbohydrate ABC transporter permease [Rectinemataceae bacterium]
MTESGRSGRLTGRQPHHSSRGAARRRRFTAFQCLMGFLLLVFIMAPFLWLLISSLSERRDLISVPLRFPPGHLSLSRYFAVFSPAGEEIARAFKYALLNSLIVATLVTAVGLVVGALASYSFARLRFAFREKLLYALLFTYMIPPIVIVLPLYVAINRLGLLDHRVTLVFLYLSMTIPFIVWVMRNYFGSISRSFEEAALIDGCTRLQTLRYIYVPMARPGLIATGILAFLLSWDEFFFALIFTSSLAAKTIPVAIAEFTGKNTVDYGMITTGGVIASIPPLLIAIFFQKYIVMGMTGGGNKE